MNFSKGIAERRNMKDATGNLNIGLVLLSSDFRVVGMNPYARQIFGASVSQLGKTVFDYHRQEIHPRIDYLLKECCASGAYMPVAMIMDVLNKFLLVHISRVDMHGAYGENLFSMTFLDVTEQTGARRNPLNQLVQIDKFPVFFKNSFLILGTSSIYFIHSDGNYCIVFTADRSYYLLMTLKGILERYAGTNFMMVHKSYIVNLDHVQGIRRENGQSLVLFDREELPDVPVARRRIKDLKAVLGANDRSSKSKNRSSNNN